MTFENVDLWIFEKFGFCDCNIYQSVRLQKDYKVTDKTPRLNTSSRAQYL